jgi:cell division protein YceG involved in septum cleavage
MNVDFQIAAWLMLFGLISFGLFNALSDQIAGTEDWFLTIENDRSRKQIIQALERKKILSWMAFAIALAVVLQGIYLIHSGYSFNMNMDPELAGRTAARARGKGAIIILVINFFPYFLIGGYGYFAYFAFLGTNDKNLKNIKLQDENIKSYSPEERQNYKEEMLRRSEEKKLKDQQIAKQVELERKRNVYQQAQINEEAPRWKTDESKEGWLINPRDGECRRYHRNVPSRPEYKGLIQIDTGRPRRDKPPAIRKTVYFKKDAAIAHWDDFISQEGWKPTTSKW